MLTKHKELLLVTLATLLLLKFVMVPWYQQQQEQLDELSSSSQRLAKVKALQQTEQPMQAELARLQKQKSDFIALLPKVVAHKTLALEIQSELEKIFEQHKVRLELFEWQGQQPFAMANVYQGRIQLRASGKLSAIGLSMLKLEQKKSYLNVQDAKVAGYPIDKTGDLNLALTLDLLYFLEQQSAE